MTSTEASPLPAYVEIERCRGCGSSPLAWDVVFAMEPMPLAGQFCQSQEEARAAIRYPLTWIRCPACGLTQVLEDVDDVVLYGRYNYGSSTVPGLVRHFEEYASFLRSRYGDGPRTVVEIGCNDGVLLSRLPSSWRRIGVDPSDVARSGRTGGYELLSAPFSLDTTRSIGERGRVNLITASNALAHFTGIREALEAAHELLGPDGEMIVEVHDLDRTLDEAQWDTIYHEHKVEWSMSSLRSCFGAVGFELAFVDHLPLHGGILRAGFKKAAEPRVTVADREPPSYERLRRAYARRRDVEPYLSLRCLQESGARTVAYGAAGRANVWLNQMSDLTVEYVVDDSPLRAGRWIPSRAIPIVPSARFAADNPDACVITAWSYASDIRAKHPSFAGRWLQTFGEL